MKIDETYRPALQKRRDAIAKAMGKLIRNNSALEAIQADEERLSAGVLRLEENRDYKSGGALAAAKESLGMCRLNLSEMSELIPRETAALRAELVALCDQSGAFTPCLRELEDSIARSLAPFCNSEHEARMVARETPMLNSFVGTFPARRWGGRHDVMAEAGEAIEHLDAILAGRCPWQWQGKAGFAVDSAMETGAPSADHDADPVQSVSCLSPEP